MTNPDPAAVRCRFRLGHPILSAQTTEAIITQECGLEPGRALAEAVLSGHEGHDESLISVVENCPMCKLARAYLNQLDGVGDEAGAAKQR